MPRRSKPLMIAPLIPLLGIVGLFGIERFGGSRLLPGFVVAWCLLLAALFAYVLSKLLDARRARAAARKWSSR